MCFVILRVRFVVCTSPREPRIYVIYSIYICNMFQRYKILLYVLGLTDLQYKYLFCKI